MLGGPRAAYAVAFSRSVSPCAVLATSTTAEFSLGFGFRKPRFCGLQIRTLKVRKPPCFIRKTR
jgi:hypothetical protein